MKSSKWMFASACVVGVGVLAGCASSSNSKVQASSDESGMQLPKGWTQDDMQACMMAGTPGQEHADLMRLAGAWTSNERMWMGPDSEPIPSSGTWRLIPILDGRYLQLEAEGNIPGMGPYKGLGLMGFDNVSKKYVATYVDQMSTGMMYGEGRMTAGGKVLTINYTYNCPINKKPAVFREVMRFESDRTMKVEMFAKDPKSRKEYMVMAAELTKQD